MDSDICHPISIIAEQSDSDKLRKLCQQITAGRLVGSILIYKTTSVIPLITLRNTSRGISSAFQALTFRPPLE